MEGILSYLGDKYDEKWWEVVEILSPRRKVKIIIRKHNREDGHWWCFIHDRSGKVWKAFPACLLLFYLKQEIWRNY